MDVYWGEGFLGQEEWNDHGHRGKGGVLGELKILFDVYKGGLGGLGALVVSLWLVWHGVRQ
jgi:hypothetical protein